MALARLGAREILPRIVEMARDDPVWSVRSWAVHAIGRLGTTEQVPVLLGMLADPSPGVRLSVAVALVRIGDERAIAPLEIAAQEESWLGRRRLRKQVRYLRKRGRLASD